MLRHAGVRGERHGAQPQRQCAAADHEPCSACGWTGTNQPAQQRNLEKDFGIPVIDRTEVIFGVFAQRAQTKEARLQVELAQVKYQAPRLKRLWTHFSRQPVLAVPVLEVRTLRVKGKNKSKSTGVS